MYRCCGCDAPAQQMCPCLPMQASAAPAPAPLWDWPEDDHKLDIQSGIRAPSHQQQEALMA